MDIERMLEICKNGQRFTLDVDRVNTHNIRSLKYFSELERHLTEYKKKQEVKPKKEKKNVTGKRAVSKKG